MPKEYSTVIETNITPNAYQGTELEVPLMSVINQILNNLWKRAVVVDIPVLRNRLSFNFK